MINVLGLSSSGDNSPYIIHAETNRVKKTNAFFSPENVKLKLDGNEKDFFNPKFNASFNASHGQIESLPLKKISDLNDQLPVDSLAESQYRSNIQMDKQREFNEQILSNFVNALGCGDDLMVLMELATLLEDPNKKSVLVTSLYGEYKFLIDLAYNKGLFDISEILKQLLENLEKDVDCFQLNRANSKAFIEIIVPNSNKNEVIFQECIKNKIDSPNEFYAKAFIDIAKQDKQSIPGLVLIYPFFIDDKQFFSELGKLGYKDKKTVRRLMEALYREGFPRNIYQIGVVEQELRFLSKKFKISDVVNSIFLNHNNLCEREHVTAQIGDVVKNQANVNETFLYWKDWTDHQIAQALTDRDLNLIGNLDLAEINNWLQDPSEISSTMHSLKSKFDTTVNWIAFQIVSEFNAGNRLKVIDRFINIGLILLSKRNFHSASQIALALRSPAVDRFLTDSERAQSDFEYLMKFSNLEKVQDQHFYTSEYDLLMPITEVFWKKLMPEAGKIQSCSNILNYDDFMEIERMARHLAIFRRAGIEGINKAANANDIKRFTEFLSNLDQPATKTNTWTGYADQSKLPLVDLKKPLCEWESDNFRLFLADNSSNDWRIKRMLQCNVWNGQSFIEAFSHNKNILRDWPDGLKETIWIKYLEHLAKPVNK